VRQHFFRRALLGLTTAAVLAGGSLVATPAEATPTPRADAAADWLQRQLNHGIVHNGQFDFDDIGLTLDFYFAFKELGVKPRVRSHILAAVEPHAGDYTGSGSERYAAQLGKLLTAVQSDGRAPGKYAGGKLFKRLNGLVKRNGRRAGRAVDQSTFGNNTETIGQAYVVRAYALGERRLTRLTTGYLLKQQCRGGFFRESMKGSLTCQSGRGEGLSQSSVDATAFAVIALKQARRSGVGRLRDAIRDALSWLRREQNRNGSFTGNGTPNANTTGLAASVLADSRYAGAARRAAEWLTGLQATHRNAGGTPLAPARGAVAYDRAGFRAGLRHGITERSRDEWRRATAQAAAGLGALRAR
jgi:hypothetical protein